MKKAKDLYNKNCKPLLKEMKENINELKDTTSCLCIGRLNIVNMSILSKVGHCINVIPIKILRTFFLHK